MTAALPATQRATGRTAGSRLAGAGRCLLARPSALYLLLTALAFPVLEMLLHGQGAVQWAVDVFDGDLPVLVALRADWLQFGPSLWDPHLTAGNASLVQMALPPFTPDFLLSFVMPLFAAYGITYAVLIWSAGYGMHLFLRDSLRLRTAACVVGGVIYMFSFWQYVQGFAVPLLPFTLWLTDRWTRGGSHRWRYGMALVAVGTFQLYAGLLQLTALVAVLQLAYLLVSNGRSSRVRRLGAEWFGVWAVCGLLFAPVAITQLVYLPVSQRTIWDVQYVYPTAPLSALRGAVSLFGSLLAAIPVAGVTTGTAQYSGTFFAGGLGLPLLYLGLFRPRDVRERFLLGMLVALPVAYFVALVVMPFQANLGFLKSFQGVRVSNLFPFALAANAALGADALLAGQWREFFKGHLRVAGLGVLLVLLGTEAVASVVNLAALPPGGRVASGWLLAAVAIGGGTLAGVMLLLWVARSRQAMAITGPVLLIFLVVLVGERATYARAERFLHPGLSTYSDYMTVDPGFAYIAKQPNPDLGRTLTAGFTANRALISGLDDAGGYQSVYSLGYHELFGVLTDPYLGTNPADWQYFHAWGNRAFPFGPELDYPVADLMGIRWIWSWNMNFQDPRLVARFHSRRDHGLREHRRVPEGVRRQQGPDVPVGTRAAERPGNRG